VTRGAAIAVVVAVLLAAMTGTARADGDPASDYLYTESVFLPAGTPSSLQAQARSTVAASRRAGAPIKLAVISSAYDLGSITPLWGKPQTYAAFLGAELSYRYHGLLLVLMPNGFGLYHGKHSVAGGRRAIAGITIHPGLSGLVSAADSAVRRLAKATGHPIARGPAASAAPPTGRAAGSGGRARAPVVLAVAGGLALIAAALIVRFRRRPRGQPSWAQRRSLPSAATLAVVVATVVAAGAVVGVVAGLATRPAAQSSALPTGATSVLSWRAGARPAPGFRLRDQSGRLVSMRSLRGHVAILAFIDPVCRNLCPLEAAILGRVERRFAPPARPTVIAVSVDPWGDSHSNLVRDIHRWKVGSGWRWAIGSRAQLARVWRAYDVGVRAQKLQVGGQTVHEITHDELIYLVDGHGDERRVYPYPFSAAEVVQAVRRLQAGTA
jgi:protein SCO1